MAATTLERRDLKAPIDWIAYSFIALFTVPFLIFNIAPILFMIGLGIAMVVSSTAFKGIRTVMQFTGVWILLGALTTTLTLILAIVARFRAGVSGGR